MSLKSVGSFTPALRPHAEWIDQNVGNKDAQLDDVELEAYKSKFPDATMYQPLKGELAAVTGNTTVKTTSVTANAPVAVGAGAGVLGFRLQGALTTTVQPTVTTKVGMPPSSVRASLPLDALTKIGASAAGDVFHLDSSSIATMGVRARQIVDPINGPGTELQLRLTDDGSKDLTLGISNGEIKAEEKPFVLEKAEFKDGATVLAKDGAYEPKAATKGSTWANAPLKAYRIEEPGKFSVEYVPPRDNPQSYRDRVRIRVFGATDGERAANLAAAQKALSMPDLLADADPTQSQRLVRLSVLRMVAPLKAEELAKDLHDIELGDVDNALKECGIDPARIGQVKLVETFPGTMAAVDPALGETYAKLGVKSVMVGVKEMEFAVKILTSDGLMSSLERYGRGLHKAGASLSSDEASGGAEFAFTRLVTPKAITDAKTISSSFGAGKVQLLSVGDAMKDLLSRTDWHAYPNDAFGVTVKKSQAEDPQADAVVKSEYSKRTSKFSERPVLDELVAQVNGDKKAPGAYSYGTPSFAQNNEACFKNGVAAEAFTHAVVGDAATRDQLIAQLKTAGCTQIHGIPVEQAVIVAQNWKQVDEQLHL